MSPLQRPPVSAEGMHGQLQPGVQVTSTSHTRACKGDLLNSTSVLKQVFLHPRCWGLGNLKTCPFLFCQFCNIPA